MRVLLVFGKNFPPCDADRLTFDYDDHSTTLARAAAWYSQWPQTGVALDNFIGSGAFQQMDASHTCHQSCCIRHITYESHFMNEDRKRCHMLAKQLRRAGMEVPIHCDQHNPPCLMQQAALSTVETYLIQFSVYRTAKGLPSLHSLPKPVDHRFKTFETRLPIQFARPVQGIVLFAADITPQLVVTNDSADDLKRACQLCDRIKTCNSFIGFCTHIWRQHKQSLEDDRCREIRRFAQYWREYWQRFPKRATGGDKTLHMIGQALGEDFHWGIVASWGLQALNEPPDPRSHLLAVASEANSSMSADI